MGSLTGAHIRAHQRTQPAEMQTMQSVYFFVSCVDYSVMLSVYIVLYFIYRSPWVLVACLSHVFLNPQINAHAGVHMHKNNTVGTMD